MTSEDPDLTRAKLIMTARPETSRNELSAQMGIPTHRFRRWVEDGHITFISQRGRPGMLPQTKATLKLVQEELVKCPTKTVPQLSALFPVSEATLRQWHKAGLIKPGKPKKPMLPKGWLKSGPVSRPYDPMMVKVAKK